jgi:mRNA-degrading endonuclease RelE of RelBE toxin-antitoxin system
MYKVKVEKSVQKYIEKLGTKQHSYFKKRFEKLQYDKKGYRLLSVSKNIELWELRSLSHRVYYTVENGFIVIDNIEYEGNIRVRDHSNKNQQQRTINKLKKKHL